jgi:farnesyl diphosphate synthase
MQNLDRQAQFQATLVTCAQAVETRLAGLLSNGERPGETTRPPRLMAAMRHGALGGGKRLRPGLAMMTAAALGSPLHQALDAGCAVELVHCYSLVHDDLPAMDNDDLRRGKPTVHKAFDEATAILAGDALLTLAFELMAAPGTHADGGVRARLVVLLAQASGLGGMVGGQLLDLAAEGRFEAGVATALDAGQIRQLQAMKTGALIRAAIMAGALIGAADEDQAEALARYGALTGAAFQIADDILDVESTAEAMGKATAKDADAGKGTLVQLLGLDAARSERDRLVDAAIAALEPFGVAADLLREAACFVAQRAS